MYSVITKAAVKLLLRPLVRFLVRQAVSFQEFLSAAKSLYVEESEKILQESGERASISRLSAMTGLNRRDIAHIQKHAGAPWYEGASVLARVLATWEHTPRYRTSSGEPIPLTKQGFSELAQAVSRDLHPGTALFELCRAGLVVVEGEQVRLRRQEVIVPGDQERGFSVVSRDISTLLALAHQNIAAPAPIKNLHLRTEFDNIDTSKIPLIQQWLLEEGREFHRRARAFLAPLDLDLSSAQGASGGGRVVLSTFGCAEIEGTATKNSGSQEPDTAKQGAA